MRLIGILGGISPVSTAYYYEVLNDLARERLGGYHSARCLIHSVDFDGIVEAHLAKDWPGVARMLSDAAQSLEAGGAECLIMACNTMHNVADEVASAASVPFLHIGDETGAHLERAGARKVGLLGTRFTMEASFIKERIQAKGIEVVVPEKRVRGEVHRVIYDELCNGRIVEASRDRFLDIVTALGEEQGIDGIVFGCTEIGLLLDPDDLPLPAFDTARIHATAALDWALGR